MDITNRVVAVLIIVVIFMFGILFFTMLNDSNEDLVGEIKVEEELFMMEIAEVIYFDGDYNTCTHISSSIEFQDLDIIFSFVKMVCLYDDYLIFESQGMMYITNAKYIIIKGNTIDDIAGLGGVYYERSK